MDRPGSSASPPAIFRERGGAAAGVNQMVNFADGELVNQVGKSMGMFTLGTVHGGA
jgi:hypothetical protein